MIIFGITGGSGSGKTTFSRLLAQMGTEVIDTDTIAHEITVPGSHCVCELADCFGKDILNADNTLNRQKLASVAFASKNKTMLLNKITHKYIKRRVLSKIESLPADSLVAIDGAVIIGSIIEPLCEFIVSVTADKNVRIKRIIERDGITAKQAEERIIAQPDDEFYKKHSRYIIYNNGDILTLKNEAAQLYNKIKN